MPTHPTALDNVRVEVAFSADPNTTSPAFVDLTSRVFTPAGIEITRGRSESSGEVQTGSCSLVLDNTDGALSPELASSPYYPNVKPQNRIRVTYRDPAVAGNLLPAEDASFEGGTTGSWAFDTFWGFPVGTLATYEWADWLPAGTKSMLITWPTAAGGCWVKTFFSGLVIGRTYTASAYVYVPTGSPDVKLDEPFGVVQGAATAVKNAWTRITATFVATATSHSTGPYVATATAGNQCWIDGIQIDEGSAPGTFTTDPAPIVHRFDGYVDEWPVEWPSGGDNDSRSAVRAFDLQSRLSRTRLLESVIAETYRLDEAGWHFPLSEGDGSASAGDRTGTGSKLAVAQYGTGGELTFGSGTGPGTDGASAPTFTPVDRYNGLFLAGVTPALDAFSLGRTLVASVLSSTLSVQRVSSWLDVWGSGLILQLDATGHAVARWVNPWAPSSDRTVTSAGIYADGRTHTMHATVSDDDAGTATLRLFVDGVERGTAATFPTNAAWSFLPVLTRVEVGGSGIGDMFAGTISHVAGFAAALSVETADHHEAATGGFAGERSDERIARIASWINLPAALMNLDVGDSTIGHVDSTGKSPWSYMQDVADTEAGVLFIDTTGVLTLHNRTRGYDSAAPVDVSVSAEVIDPDVRLSSGIAGVVNDLTVSRSGGASVRVVDAASVSTYGVLGESISTIGDSDLDVLNRANWELATRSTPVVKLPELTLDGLAEPGSSAAVRALDIGSRVQITGMPSQAPSSAADLRVQGYTERIGAGGWTLTANTTPFLPVAPLILDDDPRGRTDSTNRIVY